MTPLLTVDEVASYLKVTSRHVRELLATGRLESVRVGTRALRIREADLEAFLEAGSSGQATKSLAKPPLRFVPKPLPPGFSLEGAFRRKPRPGSKDK